MRISFIYFSTLMLSGTCCFVEACLDTILVPAYANPCCGGGPDMWSSLINTAGTSNLSIIAILNPANGPGVGPEIDPNYINNVGSIPRTTPLVDFTSAGGVAIGYVATGFGDRDMTLVKDDIDLYFDATYYKDFPVQVSGIFFDEMSNDLGKVGYYQDLYDYVKMIDPNAKVVSNPGTSFTFNDSNIDGFTVEDYANTADTIVTFENTGLEYRSNYSPPSWLNDFPASNFAHLVHSELDTNDMAGDVGLACARKAGMLYITDDVFDGTSATNPWDFLATYWEEFIATVESSTCNMDCSSGGGDSSESSESSESDSESSESESSGSSGNSNGKKKKMMMKKKKNPK